MLGVLFFLRFRMSVPEQDTVHRVCVWRRLTCLWYSGRKSGMLLITKNQQVQKIYCKRPFEENNVRKISILEKSFLEISPDGMTTLPEEAICYSSLWRRKQFDSVLPWRISTGHFCNLAKAIFLHEEDEFPILWCPCYSSINGFREDRNDSEPINGDAQRKKLKHLKQGAWLSSMFIHTHGTQQTQHLHCIVYTHAQTPAKACDIFKQHIIL